MIYFTITSATDLAVLVAGQVALVSSFFYILIKATDSDDGFRGVPKAVKDDIEYVSYIAKKVAKKVIKTFNPEYKDKKDIDMENLNNQISKQFAAVGGQKNQSKVWYSAGHATELKGMYEKGIAETKVKAQNNSQPSQIKKDDIHSRASQPFFL